MFVYQGTRRGDAATAGCMIPTGTYVAVDACDTKRTAAAPVAVVTPSTTTGPRWAAAAWPDPRPTAPTLVVVVPRRTTTGVTFAVGVR